MRRAISWAYCAPKSRMRILSLWMSVIGRRRGSWLMWVVAAIRGGPVGGGCPARPLRTGHSRTREAVPRKRVRSPHAVVRRFLGDLHVVDVALALAGAGDHHELGLAAHLLDGRA